MICVDFVYKRSNIFKKKMQIFPFSYCIGTYFHFTSSNFLLLLLLLVYYLLNNSQHIKMMCLKYVYKCSNWLLFLLHLNILLLLHCYTTWLAILSFCFFLLPCLRTHPLFSFLWGDTLISAVSQHCVNRVVMGNWRTVYNSLASV